MIHHASPPVHLRPDHDWLHIAADLRATGMGALDCLTAQKGGDQ
ncbi:MAG TPA: hypothetical protein VN688_06980 [Gemmataceae bacterium]|nr:hypothetical protein [Gemmataceae bacterium]